MKLLNAIFVLSIVLLTRCANNSTISVSSDPSGATISVVDQNGNSTDLGATPRVLLMDQVFKGGEQFKELIVSKDKYMTERVVIPRTDNTKKYKFSWKLFKVEQLSEKFLSKDQDKLASSIASAYSFISQKDYLRAESILNQALNDFSGVSVLYDLMGNLQYIKKDYKKAYKFYKKSAEYNPTNIETNKMVEKLKGIYE
jgi:tetratricopeptide (TPR) repeat protein